MNDLRTAAQQALDDLRDLHTNHNITLAGTISRLEAALAQEQTEQAWVCPEAPEERTYSKPGYCKNCGRSLVLAQVKPDHETRAELAEQQVVQLAEERDHYRNLWQQAQQQAEPNVEYERGFIDGMQKQAQSSVDRAVNRMAEQAMLGVWQDVPGAVNFGIAPQADPVEEPVAVVRWNDIGHISWRTLVMLPDGTPLYTAPPKLVPLTDEEIDAMWREATSEEGFTTAQFVRNFVRSVERKLEEKNRGR